MMKRVKKKNFNVVLTKDTDRNQNVTLHVGDWIMWLDLAIYVTCMWRLGDRNVVMIGMWLLIRSPFRSTFAQTAIPSHLGTALIAALTRWREFKSFHKLHIFELRHFCTVDGGFDEVKCAMIAGYGVHI